MHNIFSNERAAEFAPSVVIDLERELQATGIAAGLPAAAIAWHIKSPEAIQEKIAAAIRWGEETDDQRLRRDSCVRASPGTDPLRSSSGAELARNCTLVELEFENKFENPGIGGYRAIHMNYGIEGTDPTLGIGC